MAIIIILISTFSAMRHEQAAHFPGPRVFANEPIFVRAPTGGEGAERADADGAADEDSGWLLVLMFDAERARCGLFIYDASRLEEGPRGIAWLRRSVPYGLHGSWVEGETFGAI